MNKCKTESEVVLVCQWKIHRQKRNDPTKGARLRDIVVILALSVLCPGHDRSPLHDFDWFAFSCCILLDASCGLRSAIAFFLMRAASLIN